MTFTFSQRAGWVKQEGLWSLCESCELPLLAEKQRCNVTWIFLQVFNQKWRWHFLTALSSMLIFINGEKKSVLVLTVKKVAITTLWPIGFLLYNSAASLRWPVLLWNTQVTVLTASLISVYSIYILEKNYLYMSVNRKKKLFSFAFVQLKYSGKDKLYSS